jgi:hypothetical protein
MITSVSAWPEPHLGCQIGLLSQGFTSRSASRGSTKSLHSTFIFEVPVKMHKLEVMPELWDSTTEIQKIPTGEAGIKLVCSKYRVN